MYQGLRQVKVFFLGEGGRHESMDFGAQGVLRNGKKNSLMENKFNRYLYMIPIPREEFENMETGTVKLRKALTNIPWKCDAGFVDV